MALLTIGLTPTWQRVLRFDTLDVGEVNRTNEHAECAAGKAINVAVAARALGAADVLSLAIVGSGVDEARFAEDVAAEGVELVAVRCAAPLRTCTTLLEAGGRATELVENASAVDASTVDALRAQHAALAPRARLQTLSGSLPPGTPETIYRELIEQANAAHGASGGEAAAAAAASGCPSLIDARGPALEAALGAGPLLVKPNLEELAATAGLAADADEQATAAAMAALVDRGAQWVLVSDGPRPARLLGRGRALERIQVPAPHTRVNPIGCGDALLAGIAVALEGGATMRDAVGCGLDAAARNLATLLPGRL